MSQSEFEKARDEAAVAWEVENTNHNSEYIIAACKAGWNACERYMLEKDARVRGLVEALWLIVMQRENFVEDAAENAIEIANEAIQAFEREREGMR